MVKGPVKSLRFPLALAHDLGHPPFGHAGEAALDEAAVSLKRIHNTYDSLRSYTPRGEDGAEELVAKARQGFIAEMDDDFNSRGALQMVCLGADACDIPVSVHQD